MNTPTPATNAFFRQLLFLAVLITMGLVIFFQLSLFIASFLGAITLYVILRNTQFRLTEKKKWKASLAALLLVMATTLVLLGIGYLIFEMVASELAAVDTSKIVTRLNLSLATLNETIGYKIVPTKILNGLEGFLTKILSSILNTTYSFAANTLMMLAILYFMLAHGRKMEQTILIYAPFKGESLDMLKNEFKRMIFSNAIGIPLIMIAQSAMACLIYLLLGINNVLFWGFLTGIFGLVPIVGTAIVWLPLTIAFFAGGEYMQAVVLLIYGTIVISNMDNLCRIVLMKRVSNTHPLVVIFGVMLGLPLFGFWGIIFGPLLLSLFILLIKIYFVEYGLMNKQSSL